MAVKWFAPETDQEWALGILTSERPLLAPDLVISETMHALRKKLRSGDVVTEQFMRAGAALGSYFDTLAPTLSVAPDAARLSVQLDHGFYDCVYLALALSTGGELASADEAFLRKVRSARLPVDLQGIPAGL